MTNSRILILDDNEAILEVVTEALRYENYEVLDISFGYQLIYAVADFSPELILMDYRLADTNGGDLCQALKNDPAYRHIPVIIFSAYFTPSDANSPGGCDGILYKPFDLDQLLNIVHLHIEPSQIKEVS
ncbi:response regulator [Mucilaginibacter sp. E4BP6]|uniref:response regulator n=1 Tax=Mucilaginibacter sp. E4BP6 TaxID=2723089 RepID=UPI0015CE15B1|nr:response regulator [Mucilaginibacter sp. E4BP6]NYE67831.1 CheY-like chemotaxis protein [Mucilaginibacter sp. E4BP6]